MEEFLKQVCHKCAGISSIWLIGSRANDTAKEDSDWDFIVFADQAILECIKGEKDLHLPNVDFLVVYDGESFVNAWGEKEKTGSLSHWQWKQTSSDQAEYKGAKWIDGEDGGVVSQRHKAILMWPKHKAT